MNDGKCDERGRFWAGTMACDARPGRGALYRLDPAYSVSCVLRGLSIPNGVDWSSDGRTMYFADSGERRIDCFDWDAETGTIAGRRPFVGFGRDEGVPDGLTVDAEGYLWVAMWGGWCVRRYAPDGQLARVVEVPVARVSSCAFGGPDLRDLYITTASGGLDAAERERQPDAGGVFRLRTDVSGRPPNSFAG
jgi:sugar lactone lactonase YvrE